MCALAHFFSFFFFNDTATTEIYTLSLHDALPICSRWPPSSPTRHARKCSGPLSNHAPPHESCASHPRTDRDRKSTRLNSSHQIISYAVFCLKKKKQTHVCSARIC